MKISKTSYCLFVLAHGAGNDIQSDFITSIQEILEENNIATFCFNFVYKENGKKLPGSKKGLNDEYLDVWTYIEEKYPNLPLFAGGKSMR